MTDMILTEVKINKNGITFKSKGYTADEVVKMLGLLVGELNNIPAATYTSKQRPIQNQIKTAPKEDVEVFDVRELMGEVKLPRLTNNFRCPSCSQSIALINNKDNTLLIKANNKLHSVSVDLSSLPEIAYDKEKGADYPAVIALLNDLIANHNNDNISLVSDSEDHVVCPICRLEAEINKFIKEYDSNLSSSDCPVCGGATEQVITKNEQTIKCLDNDCLAQLNA